jgi:hypothetical protein
VAKLIADLDADEFATRENASAELEKLGSAAVPALRRVLAGKPSEEVRRRTERLLDRLGGRGLTSDELLALRGVEVLERAGTPEAKELLKELAKGSPQARMTLEAKASLERLAKRAAKP